MPPRDKSELALVAACVAGDAAAWKRFYARFEPLILRAAERALLRIGVADPRAYAQDVAADVFAHLVERDHAVLGRFEGRSSLATWLRVITSRRASRSVRRRRPGSLEEPEAVRGQGPSPSDIAQVSERDSILREQLETLSPRDRLALQLFYEGGRSYKEVGEALGLPPENVGTLLARARKRLAAALRGPRER
jgi:RNA polymerase sigma-70 factor, ECF subfamily